MECLFVATWTLIILLPDASFLHVVRRVKDDGRDITGIKGSARDISLIRFTPGSIAWFLGLRGPMGAIRVEAARPAWGWSGAREIGDSVTDSRRVDAGLSSV